MNALTPSSRFIHNREIAPPPTWCLQVPLAPSARPSVGMSEVSRVIARREQEIFDSYRVVTSYRLPLDLRFFTLAMQWKRDTFFESSPWRMAAHPAYQRIIGMGWPVVPLILGQLSREADFWFEALVAVTGEQPVPLAHAGHIEAMRQDWLRWGREHGYDC